MPPRRAREQIDAGSRPSVRGRRRDSRRWFETVPSLRTPSFSRFCEGRRRASRAPKAIRALRYQVENGILVLPRPFASNFVKVPGKSIRHMRARVVTPEKGISSGKNPTMFFFHGPSQIKKNSVGLFSSSNHNYFKPFEPPCNSRPDPSPSSVATAGIRCRSTPGMAANPRSF